MTMIIPNGEHQKYFLPINDIIKTSNNDPLTSNESINLFDDILQKCANYFQICSRSGSYGTQTFSSKIVPFKIFSQNLSKFHYKRTPKHEAESRRQLMINKMISKRNSAPYFLTPIKDIKKSFRKMKLAKPQVSHLEKIESSLEEYELMKHVSKPQVIRKHQVAEENQIYTKGVEIVEPQKKIYSISNEITIKRNLKIHKTKVSNPKTSTITYYSPNHNSKELKKKIKKRINNYNLNIFATGKKIKNNKRILIEPEEIVSNFLLKTAKADKPIIKRGQLKCIAINDLNLNKNDLSNEIIKETLSSQNQSTEITNDSDENGESFYRLNSIKSMDYEDWEKSKSIKHQSSEKSSSKLNDLSGENRIKRPYNICRIEENFELIENRKPLDSPVLIKENINDDLEIEASFPTWKTDCNNRFNNKCYSPINKSRNILMKNSPLKNMNKIQQISSENNVKDCTNISIFNYESMQITSQINDELNKLKLSKEIIVDFTEIDQYKGQVMKVDYRNSNSDEFTISKSPSTELSTHVSPISTRKSFSMKKSVNKFLINHKSIKPFRKNKLKKYKSSEEMSSFNDMLNDHYDSLDYVKKILRTSFNQLNLRVVKDQINIEIVKGERKDKEKNINFYNNNNSSANFNCPENDSKILMTTEISCVNFPTIIGNTNKIIFKQNHNKFQLNNINQKTSNIINNESKINEENQTKATNSIEKCPNKEMTHDGNENVKNGPYKELSELWKKNKVEKQVKKFNKQSTKIKFKKSIDTKKKSLSHSGGLKFKNEIFPNGEGIITHDEFIKSFEKHHSKSLGKGFRLVVEDEFNRGFKLKPNDFDMQNEKKKLAKENLKNRYNTINMKLINSTSKSTLDQIFSYFNSKNYLSEINRTSIVCTSGKHLEKNTKKSVHLEHDKNDDFGHTGKNKLIHSNFQENLLVSGDFYNDRKYDSHDSLNIAKKCNATKYARNKFKHNFDRTIKNKSKKNNDYSLKRKISNIEHNYHKFTKMISLMDKNYINVHGDIGNHNLESNISLVYSENPLETSYITAPSCSSIKNKSETKVIVSPIVGDSNENEFEKVVEVDLEQSVSQKSSRSNSEEDRQEKEDNNEDAMDQVYNEEKVNEDEVNDEEVNEDEDNYKEDNEDLKSKEVSEQKDIEQDENNVISNGGDENLNSGSNLEVSNRSSNKADSENDSNCIEFKVNSVVEEGKYIETESIHDKNSVRSSLTSKQCSCNEFVVSGSKTACQCHCEMFSIGSSSVGLGVGIDRNEDERKDSSIQHSSKSSKGHSECEKIDMSSSIRSKSGSSKVDKIKSNSEEKHSSANSKSKEENVKNGSSLKPPSQIHSGSSKGSADCENFKVSSSSGSKLSPPGSRGISGLEKYSSDSSKGIELPSEENGIVKGSLNPSIKHPSDMSNGGSDCETFKMSSATGSKLDQFEMSERNDKIEINPKEKHSSRSTEGDDDIDVSPEEKHSSDSAKNEGSLKEEIIKSNSSEADNEDKSNNEENDEEGKSSDNSKNSGGDGNIKSNSSEAEAEAENENEDKGEDNNEGNTEKEQSSENSKEGNFKSNSSEAENGSGVENEDRDNNEGNLEEKKSSEKSNGGSSKEENLKSNSSEAENEEGGLSQDSELSKSGSIQVNDSKGISMLINHSSESSKSKANSTSMKKNINLTCLECTKLKNECQCDWLSNTASIITPVNEYGTNKSKNNDISRLDQSYCLNSMIYEKNQTKSNEHNVKKQNLNHKKYKYSFDDKNGISGSGNSTLLTQNNELDLNVESSMSQCRNEMTCENYRLIDSETNSELNDTISNQISFDKLTTVTPSDIIFNCKVTKLSSFYSKSKIRSTKKLEKLEDVNSIEIEITPKKLQYINSHLNLETFGNRSKVIRSQIQVHEFSEYKTHELYANDSKNALKSSNNGIESYKPVQSNMNEFPIKIYETQDLERTESIYSVIVDEDNSESSNNKVVMSLINNGSNFQLDTSSYGLSSINDKDDLEEEN